MFLQWIINTYPAQPRFPAYSRTVNQHVKYRQQHDTCKIRDQQSHRYRKSLIIEQCPRNATHKYQWNKNSDSSQ